MVIAIISILAALLLPALAKAKARARTIECLNNKKQLGLVWLMYADEHNDWLVPNSLDPFWRFSLPFSANWVSGGIGWGTSSEITNYSLLVNPIHAPLAPYLSSATKPYKCPADTFLSPEQRAIGWQERIRSVAMNKFMGDGDPVIDFLGTRFRKGGPLWRDGPYRVYKRLSDMRQLSPAQAWTIVDEHPDSIDDGYFGFVIHTNGPTQWGSVAGSYHHGACKLVFADAHAEIKQWLVPQTKQPVRYIGWSDPAPARTPDRRDYDWFISRTAERWDGLPMFGQ